MPLAKPSCGLTGLTVRPLRLITPRSEGSAP
ncbi:Uncharacterised protein [Vibrio cholerae]|nr:Uncharacterised protein [Vibrio cholerae]